MLLLNYRSFYLYLNLAQCYNQLTALFLWLILAQPLLVSYFIFLPYIYFLKYIIYVLLLISIIFKWFFWLFFLSFFLSFIHFFFPFSYLVDTAIDTTEPASPIYTGSAGLRDILDTTLLVRKLWYLIFFSFRQDYFFIFISFISYNL